MKAYSCMPPGETIDGTDLPQSTASYEGASGSAAPTLAVLKRGYSDAEAAGSLADVRLNLPFPEPGFGGFCGRPNGWER